jgi:hypothetical protein
LLFFFDKEFNLKNKLFDVLPVYVAIPPFISNPILKNGDEIIYFDNFRSNIHLIHLDDSIHSRLIRFGMGNAVPPEVFADPQEFFSNQGNYSFFLDAFVVNDLLWAVFSDRGKQCVLVMNLKTQKKIICELKSWWLNLLFYKNDAYYSSIDPEWIVDGQDMFAVKMASKYPVDYDSNPVILKFKAKYLLK